MASSHLYQDCLPRAAAGHCCVPCMQCLGCKSNTSQASGCRQAPQDWGDSLYPLRSGVLPFLSTALQSMGLQPPWRRMERVVDPLGKLGKEEPASAGAKARQEVAGSTRHHRNAHAQPRPHLTHLHQHRSKELLVHSMCLSLPNSPSSEHTRTFRVYKQSSPLQHCFSVVLMSDSAPPYQPGTCAGWREFIRGLVMEQDAGPFDPHLARKSTLLPLPSRAEPSPHPRGGMNSAEPFSRSLGCW